MKGETIFPKPEKKEILEDNARKFICKPIDHAFLKQHNASSFTLAVDWIETEQDSEKKLAYKRFENGDIQMLLISKATHEGNRVAEKKKINDEEYQKLKESSILHLEKKRFEFMFIQNNMLFSIKYDEFKDGAFCMIEVDAESTEERDAFDPIAFQGDISEVTGNSDYYGYRVATMI